MSNSSRLELVAHPTRLRLLRALADRGTASLRDLADAAGVHPNTLRPHIADLEAAGVVLRDPTPAGGRGRPRLLYRLGDGWRLPSSDFHGLAEVLAALVLRLAPAPDEVRRLGRDWGRYLVGRPGSHDAAGEIPRAMERLGFDVRISGSELSLSECPCPLVMPGRPELVCGLATAVIEGMLDAAGSPLSLTGASHDPARRRCVAQLR